MRPKSAPPDLLQRMTPGAYRDPNRQGSEDPPTTSLELFERMLRRSFAAGVEREYTSFTPFQPVAGAYDAAVFHLAVRTTGVGGTPTVKIVFDDSSDGANWTTMVTYTEAGPSDGTYRYVVPTPFGGFVRVRLLISGSGGIGYVICRGVMSVRRVEDAREWVGLAGRHLGVARSTPCLSIGEEPPNEPVAGDCPCQDEKSRRRVAEPCDACSNIYVRG